MLLQGKFLERPNRFIAYCDLDGERVKCHVPNTGSMKELLIPGVIVYLRYSDAKNRSTSYSLLFVENRGELVSLDSQLPNKIVAESIANCELEDFQGYDIVKREVSHGNSRIDIYLEDSRGLLKPMYVEVKNVNLVDRENMAMFPDAVTARGTKHLGELRKLKDGGEFECAVVFLITHPLGKSFRAHFEKDLVFAKELHQTYTSGVLVVPLICKIEDFQVLITGKVPFYDYEEIK